MLYNIARVFITRLLTLSLCIRACAVLLLRYLLISKKVQSKAKQGQLEFWTAVKKHQLNRFRVSISIINMPIRR
ncbi:hypothetical protein F5879DRAFT_605572 [Lentinula edodes]|nr:hypothetical protein F5879DRAFT_605572 [Lentinula edodes]